MTRVKIVAMSGRVGSPPLDPSTPVQLATGTNRPRAGYGAQRVRRTPPRGQHQHVGGTRTSCSTVIHPLVAAGWPASSPALRSPGCSYRRQPTRSRRRPPASGATTTSTTSCSSASPWPGSGSTKRRSRRSPTPTAAPASTRRPGYTASVDYVGRDDVGGRLGGRARAVHLRGGRRRARAADTGAGHLRRRGGFTGTALGDVTATCSRSTSTWYPRGPTRAAATARSPRPLVGAPLVADPAGADDFAGFPAGAIALIQRGGCSFALKAHNAQAAGASAVIIFNQGNTPDREGP